MDKGSPSTIVHDFKQTPVFVRVLFLVLFVALIGGGYYLYVKLQTAEKQLTQTTAVFETTVRELQNTVAALTEENEELSDDLRDEKRRNQKFEDQIEDIAGTVSELDKLRRLDPELLIKYSKISFLNEHYLPERLDPIEQKFVFGSTEQRIHSRVEPFLDDLLGEAEEDGVDLRVVSAYRSFGTQAALKSQYTVIYGSGANQFSADQGYSEHQLGTTVDFSVPEFSGRLEGFDATPAYQWLLKNAHKYGFILSYPPNNIYYQFEPWHWRFVGIDLASDLHKAGKYFYDMDQRDIDKYLINIFD